jgi:hypothetical protein
LLLLLSYFCPFRIDRHWEVLAQSLAIVALLRQYQSKNGKEKFKLNSWHALAPLIDGEKSYFRYVHDLLFFFSCFFTVLMFIFVFVLVQTTDS